jgi:hypothetical protein
MLLLQAGITLSPNSAATGRRAARTRFACAHRVAPATEAGDMGLRRQGNNCLIRIMLA